MNVFTQFFAYALSFASLGLITINAADPSRGLWVGEVTLNAVNEATGAVGDSNTYEFTDPAVVTPTSDAAYLRLILHVNGAGQVRLLKSVAIVQGDEQADGSSDIVLLTDPELFPDYPGIAKRIASAFYDFGDARAVEAIQALIDAAVTTAVDEALDFKSEAQILDLLVNDSGTGQLNGIADSADVATAYYKDGAGFLIDDFFTLADVLVLAEEVATLIDGGASPSDFAYDGSVGSYAPFTIEPVLPDRDFSNTVLAAEQLRNASFYGDTRGIEAIVDIVTRAAGAATGADLDEKKARAKLAAEAAWHNAADFDQGYNRFLARNDYQSIPETIVDVAVAEAIAAQGRGELEAEIRSSVETVVRAEPVVQGADGAATQLETESLWGDPRARRALESLVGTTVNTATEQVLISTDSVLLTQTVGDALGEAYGAVVAGVIFATAPSAAYTDYVRNPDYLGAAVTAAETAASEAVFQVGVNVDDPADLAVLVDRAVSDALIFPRNQVASLPVHSVPLAGSLVPGETAMGAFELPALAPSNPFLHRQHPDHSVGFPIRRTIALSVDSVPGGEGFLTAGYGVSRLTGTYTEEIEGLHKPLGSEQDIGLITEGSFILNRLTLVDTLNF